MKLSDSPPEAHDILLRRDGEAAPEGIAVVEASSLQDYLDAQSEAGRRVFVNRGRTKSKPRVYIRPNKSKARGNAQDTIVLLLEGVPENYGPVQLKVGADLVDYDDPEGLAVAWQGANQITVLIQDPFLFQENRVMLRFE